MNTHFIANRKSYPEGIKGRSVRVSAIIGVFFKLINSIKKTKQLLAVID